MSRELDPGVGPKRQSLIASIEALASQIEHLDREVAAARAHLTDLRAQLARLGPEPAIRVVVPSTTRAAVPTNPGGKVRLFRELFRGRTDVFPTRFVSPKTGKSGYAPACGNKFVRGVCELPRIKCSACPNPAFTAVTDEQVLRHLRGEHVMGVYPLLDDDTCWFLAVDFDEGTWAEDVVAFADTARRVGLHPAIERSRSGNGAHVWFFFLTPVAAGSARKVGSYLITETMNARHELSMRSYDRLFPSQDTLPRGGFGNLIALPLQWEARSKGNTLFLDEKLMPFPDDAQWAYLACIPRIPPETVEAIAAEADRVGAVLGVRSVDELDETSTAPWMALPSRRRARAAIPGPLPGTVRAVLAQRIYVEKAGLPAVLLNAIQRLAAFQNPEFYQRQGMRLSTALTPRIISCAEGLPSHVALPRGCRADLEELLASHGVTLELDDQRHAGEPVARTFHGSLTPMQENAAQALLASDVGIFVAPPGAGKTVVGTYLVAKRPVSTLILVHRQPLLEQWVAQLSLFLGLEAKAIGRIGGSKRRHTGNVDVAMIQSLVRRGAVDDLVAGYGQVIVDECHHLPAVSFERVLNEVRARYVVGLTATPQRRDGHHPIMRMQLGPVRYSVDPRNQTARRPFEHRLVIRETGFRGDRVPVDAAIQDLYAALAGHEARNRLILDDILVALEEGRSPIVLTERRDHLAYFEARLRGFARHLVVLQGGQSAKVRRALVAQLAAIPPDEERLLLATGRYIGEGFDDGRLDTLFLALPVSWKGTLVQYAGRLHRLHPRKTEVRIYDYVDREIPMLRRMHEKRLVAYRGIGYAVGPPQGAATPARGGRRVEWDAAGMSADESD